MYIQHRRRYLSAAITGRSFYMVPSLYSSFWCVGYIPRGLDAYGQQTCVHTHLTYVQEEKGNKRPDYPVGGSNPIHSKVFCFFFDLLFLETCPLTLSRNISIRLPPPQRALAPQQKSWKTKEHKGFYTYADRGYTFIYLYRLRLYFYFTSLVDFLHGIPIAFTPFFLWWDSLLYRETYGAAAAVSAHRQKDDQKPLSSLLTRATSAARALLVVLHQHSII